MNIYELNDLSALLKNNSYPGRGIVIGQSADGRNAVFAYFIMGRSENSRNRIFAENGETVTTRPFDPSKVKDPSLIIYSPVRVLGNRIIVTNGDQTDTIYHAFESGGTFEGALTTRSFEPDEPNFTPRISGLLTFENGGFSYKMSILKSADASGTACNRFTYIYSPIVGTGHFLHTYLCDGNPIPTFQGEPEQVSIGNKIDSFSVSLWENLNENNKISLYVRYTDLKTGAWERRLFNKYGSEAKR
ncbi:hypothetical protein SDC9_53859 [bioreactor metagenome]|uniref:Inosine monophosphate cyclohydrolase-like domain-containing protein n=1 Tax=bioreactor metagenome TaxID=1076179 RepID=A0A644WZU5_9ZZZZ